MQCDHLYLLIGTNPLPNLVVAEYFLKQPKQPETIYFIHSPDTAEIARRLRQVLHERNGEFHHQFIDITDARDAAKVRYELNEKLIFHRGQQHHLNYTGGTKNMAVQAYAALIEKAGPDRHHLLSFSYLDAQQFKLKTDDGKWVSEDLRSQIEIKKILQLLILHDCKPKDGKEKKEAAVEWYAANDIMNRYIEQNRIADFIKWKNDVIRRYFYKMGKPRKPQESITLDDLRFPHENSIRSYSKQPHPFHDSAMQLISSFPPKQAWKFSEDGVLDIPDSRTKFNEKKGDFVLGILYLDGFWFEYYIQQILANYLDEKDGIRFFSNLHIVKGAAEKNFEIDCILIKGYQVCGISITTSLKEGECKSKAFEILHRSHQIGGDEARAILITVLDPATVQKIEDDLQHDTGGPIPLKVLGAEDLMPERLIEKIRDHMLGV